MNGYKWYGLLNWKNHQSLLQLRWRYILDSFWKIFEYSEFDDDIVNRIKNELNAHKDIRICEVWDYCFLIRGNKYFTEEEIDR